MIRLRILDPHSPHFPIVILALPSTSHWTLAVLSNEAPRTVQHADLVALANGMLDPSFPVFDGVSLGRAAGGAVCGEEGETVPL